MSDVKKVIPYDKDYQYTALWSIILVTLCAFSFVSIFVSMFFIEKGNYEHPGTIIYLSSIVIFFASLLPIFIFRNTNKHKRYRKADLYFTKNDQGAVVCYNDQPPEGLVAVHVALGKKVTCTTLINEGNAWRQYKICKLELRYLMGDEILFNFTQYNYDPTTTTAFIGDILDFAMISSNRRADGSEFSIYRRGCSSFKLAHFNYIHTAWDRATQELVDSKVKRSLLVTTLSQVLVNLVSHLVTEKRKSEPAQRLRESIEGGIIDFLPAELLDQVLATAERMISKTATVSESKEIFMKLKARLLSQKTDTAA